MVLRPRLSNRLYLLTFGALLFVICIYHGKYHDVDISAELMRKKLMDDSRKALPIMPRTKMHQYDKNHVKIRLDELRKKTKFMVKTSKTVGNHTNMVHKKHTVQLAKHVQFPAKMNSTVYGALKYEPEIQEVENVVRQGNRSPDHAQLLYVKKVNSTSSILQESRSKSKGISKNTENLKMFEEIMRLTNDSTVPYDRILLSTTEKRARIRELYSAIFHELSGPRTPKFKTPCHCMFWEESDENRCFFTGCLPYFYLIGAPKSGTTDLWFNINAHPDIIKLEKEPHWWTKQGKSGMDLRKYMFHYSEPLIEMDKRGTSRTKEMIIGDGSASTLWNNIGIIHQTYITTHRLGLPFTWADVIHEIQPDAKIIAILRNPVNRVISDYFAFEGDNHSPQDFHDKITDAISEFNGCLLKFDVRFCGNLMYHPRIQIGLYAVHVQDWLQSFPANHVLILRTEDWQADKGQRLLPKIFSFLDIEPLHGKAKLPSAIMDTRWIRVIKSKVMSQKYAAEYDNIFASSVKILQEFYATYNQQLADLLNDPAFLWL